jgi:transcriptional regulator with XRE-family HTH domain
MLATTLVQEVDRLLTDGRLSQREIAMRLGVSRGTVNAIASGRRGLHGKDAEAEDAHTSAPASAPVRCPRCGYRIYAPCLICRTRDHKNRQPDQQLKPSRVSPLHSESQSPHSRRGN